MPTGVYKRTDETRKRMSASKMGHPPTNTGFEENAANWKGNKVGYWGLHKWVEKHLGKPHFCEHCGKRNLKHRQYNWANKSKKYKRVLSDWLRLCIKCHKAFDKK